MSASVGDSSGRPARFTPRAILRRLIPRWSFSTWLLVLLATVVLFFVEVPGRRVGATKYAHGWPFVYLVVTARCIDDDSQSDATGATPIFQAGDLSNTEFIAGTRLPPVAWTIGFPYSYEEQMTPWSFDGIRFGWPMIADAAVAIALLLAFGNLREAWRRRRGASTVRRRFFQYRLRTLLLAVPLVAFASAKLAAWHSEYVAEQSLLNDGVIAPEAEPIEVVWQPPSWIPESVLKLGPTAWFAHIYELNFGTREDLPIDRIRKLRHLQVLKCAAPKAEDVAQVADFSSLREFADRRSRHRCDRNKSGSANYRSFVA